MSAKYRKGMEGIGLQEIDMIADDIRAVLVDTALYTVNLATDKFLSSIPVGARNAMTPALSGKSFTDGIFDAADQNVDVPGGVSIEAVVLVKWTGDAATSRLILYVDSGPGLPGSPPAGTVSLRWNNGSTKIFQL